MPRMSLLRQAQPDQRPEQRLRLLIKFHKQLTDQRQGAVVLARQCGGLFLEITPPEQAVLARDAAISRRTMYHYIDVHKYWDLVKDAEGLTAAYRMIREAKRASATRCTEEREKKRFEIKVDNASPEVLAHALGTVRGQKVAITIRVTRNVPATGDPRQRPLPFLD